MPEMTPANASTGASDIAIDQEIILAAPLWDDWAKTIVLQWIAAGAKFPELNIGGNGKTDKYGEAGNSKNRRAPYSGGRRSDGARPAARRCRGAGFGARGTGGRAGVHGRELAAQCRDDCPKRSDRSGIQQNLPDQPDVLVEYVLHNMSDADYPFTGAAIVEVQVLLRKIAGQFGYDENDTANYNTKFRNPVLSQFSAERLQIIYAAQGIDGGVAEVEKVEAGGDDLGNR